MGQIRILPVPDFLSVPSAMTPWPISQEWNWSSTWTFCVRGHWVPDQKGGWLLWHLGGRGRGLTSVERFRERNGQMALKLEGLPRHLGPWPLAFELFAGAMNSTFSRFTRWPICFVQCLVNDVNGIQDCFRKWEVERRRLLRGILNQCISMLLAPFCNLSDDAKLSPFLQWIRGLAFFPALYIHYPPPNCCFSSFLYCFLDRLLAYFQ